VRYAGFLGQRYRAILGYTGLLCLIASLLIASPLVLLIAYPQEGPLAWGFLLPAGLLGLPALLLWRRLTPRAVTLTMQEGAVIVVLTWVVTLLVGAVPFMVSRELAFTHALFESTSGWTTAGLSVLDVSRAPVLILFYRSIIQLAGGAGLAILMLSALAGPVGPGLSVAEGRPEQLLPHVRRSARLVLTMYSGYIVVGIVGLRLAGMNWFDAVNHAFTALSTGGFSTRAESIAYWHSPAVEAVTIVLMLLGTLNFLTAYTFLQRKYRAVARNSEVRQTVFLIVVGSGVLLFGVTGGLYPALGERLRVSVFNTVSVLSTTGFATVDYAHWNGLGWLLLILFMLMGGGTGSTAGGIKQYRIYVLCRGLVWEFRRRFLPSSVVSEPDVWRGEEKHFITDRHLRQIALFVFLYLSVFFVGSGMIAAYGYPLQDSLFEFASALGTVGISVGITTVGAPAGVLWVEMAAMFLGRLEFFTIVIGLLRLCRDLPVMLSSWVGSRLPAVGSRTATASGSQRSATLVEEGSNGDQGISIEGPGESDSPS
jgi:trk system potassium uptake protein TrkH